MYMVHKASLVDVNMLTEGHPSYFRNHHIHMVLKCIILPHKCDLNKTTNTYPAPYTTGAQSVHKALIRQYKTP